MCEFFTLHAFHFTAGGNTKDPKTAIKKCRMQELQLLGNLDKGGYTTTTDGAASIAQCNGKLFVICMLSTAIFVN